MSNNSLHMLILVASLPQNTSQHTCHMSMLCSPIIYLDRLVNCQAHEWSRVNMSQCMNDDSNLHKHKMDMTVRKSIHLGALTTAYVGCHCLQGMRGTAV